MPVLAVNGARIGYTDTGRDGLPGVLFGHGLLFSGSMFRAQVAALRDDYRCVTIDWRGQGCTPPTQRGYDMDTLTADAVAVIEALGLAPVHFVGLSMGGFVGQRIAARHGDLLRSLVLLDTSADREPPLSALQDKLLAAIFRWIGMNPVLVGRVLPMMFGPAFRHDPDSRPVIAEFIADLRRCDRAGLAKAVRAVADRAPIYAELDRVAVPTLVIVGADDRPTPPAKARRIAERIPGARLEIVPACGHSSTVEQPGAVTQLISDFLARIS